MKMMMNQKKPVQNINNSCVVNKYIKTEEV